LQRPAIPLNSSDPNGTRARQCRRGSARRRSPALELLLSAGAARSLFGPPPGPARRRASTAAARTSLDRRARRRAFRPTLTPAARAQDRLDGSRNAGAMLTDVWLILYNTYNILIILYRARRARRIPTVLCEVMGRSIGPATISSPFSGAGALRVVYAPEIQAIFFGFAWFWLGE
jgi:hypothetical protein